MPIRTMVFRPKIYPSIVHLEAEASQRFSLVQAKGMCHIAWFVEGIPGGNDLVGRITKEGEYTAPSNRPRPSQIHIQAKLGGPAECYAWATVIIGKDNPRYAYAGFWDLKGEEEGKLLEAHGVGMEPSGNILIADPIRSVILRYSPLGKYLGQIGRGRGSAPGELDGPRDVKADQRGRIYVADGNNNRIQVFSENGEPLQAWGRKGSSAGELQRPHSLDIGPDGSIFVADVDNSRVVVFDLNHGYLRAWGRRGDGPGEFLAPHGVATDPNGDVFVVEYDGRCQKFTPTGELLFAFANKPAEETRAHGYLRYHAMASDRWGDVYLMARDTRHNFAASIDKYNNNGDPVTRFSLPPSENRRMGAQGAAVSTNGRVYVVDTESGRAGISIFDPL